MVRFEPSKRQSRKDEINRLVSAALKKAAKNGIVKKDRAGRYRLTAKGIAKYKRAQTQQQQLR